MLTSVCSACLWPSCAQTHYPLGYFFFFFTVCLCSVFSPASRPTVGCVSFRRQGQHAGSEGTFSHTNRQCHDPPSAGPPHAHTHTHRHTHTHTHTSLQCQLKPLTTGSSFPPIVSSLCKGAFTRSPSWNPM